MRAAMTQDDHGNTGADMPGATLKKTGDYAPTAWDSRRPRRCRGSNSTFLPHENTVVRRHGVIPQ